MELLPAEKKLLYMFTPVCLFVGFDAGNPVLIVGGLACLAWIAWRWRPGAKSEKTKVVND